MADQIWWAGLLDPATAVSEMPWPQRAFMYLERVPAGWIDDADAESGIRLEVLDTSTPFHEWERGRVFCSDFELRWEKQDGRYGAVLVGNAPPATEFVPATELALASAVATTHRYLLWGRRVAEDQFETIGAESSPHSRVFLELRVPRILHYPVAADAQEAALVVREYSDPATGELLYHRFLDVEGLP